MIFLVEFLEMQLLPGMQIFTSLEKQLPNSSPKACTNLCYHKMYENDFFPMFFTVIDKIIS